MSLHLGSALLALLLLGACSARRAAGRARAVASEHVADAAGSRADSAAVGFGALAVLPVAPAPPAVNATPGQVRRYRRAMKAYAVGVAAHRRGGPSKVKVTGSGSYAGPGAEQTTANGKNAAAAAPAGLAVAARGVEQVAPVVGDGNRIEPPKEELTPFPYWLLALAGLVAGYGLYRHFNRS